jgi:tetratricopeptide (TPR) repeat protein
MNLLIKSPFEEVGRAIALIREKAGEETKALVWIDQAIKFGKGFMVTLYFERILVYQHLVMEEDSKPEDKKDLNRKRAALAKMAAATIVTQKYVEENNLKEWYSRVYRFLGRLYDYKGQFGKSVAAYRKALPLSKFDPEYVEKGVPRWLELEGFLSYALIMSGEVAKGVSFAKKTFKKYDSNNEALALKKKDYYTWAVWKSGIPIRTINGLLAKKLSFDRQEMQAWLSDAETVLDPPKSAKNWGDFGIRKTELEAVKRRLQEIN